MKLTIAFLVCVIGGTSCVTPARASEPKEKLRTIETELTRQKEQADTLEQKSKEASQNLKELKTRLITASSALEAKEEEQEDLEDKSTSLANDIKSKSVALNDERQKLDLSMQALIEMSLQPPESLLLHSGLTADTLHRTILLRAVVPRIKDQTVALAHDLLLLGELKVKLAQQKRLLASTTQNLQEQRRGLDQLVQTRQGFLQRTEAQKDAISAQLVSLAAEAQDLRQLLEKVSPRREHRSPDNAAPSVKLIWPVSGHVLHHYGERDADGVTSEGITFAALPASPVVAPARGKVVFAGVFKGYGHIVILQHEGGFHSFLAGFGRVDAEMAQEVDAGEPLGVTPVEPNTRPQIYFEWRHNNDPVEPAGFEGSGPETKASRH